MESAGDGIGWTSPAMPIAKGRREQHLPRNFAWRYRDYVIRSFNADKPYDRFPRRTDRGR